MPWLIPGVYKSPFLRWIPNYFLHRFAGSVGKLPDQTPQQHLSSWPCVGFFKFFGLQPKFYQWPGSPVLIHYPLVQVDHQGTSEYFMVAYSNPKKAGKVEDKDGSSMIFCLEFPGVQLFYLCLLEKGNFETATFPDQTATFGKPVYVTFQHVARTTPTLNHLILLKLLALTPLLSVTKRFRHQWQRYLRMSDVSGICGGAIQMSSRTWRRGTTDDQNMAFPRYLTWTYLWYMRMMVRLHCDSGKWLWTSASWKGHTAKTCENWTKSWTISDSHKKGAHFVWWVVSTPLKHITVISWDDYSQHMGKSKMFQTTNQHVA